MPTQAKNFALEHARGTIADSQTDKYSALAPFPNQQESAVCIHVQEKRNRNRLHVPCPVCAAHAQYSLGKRSRLSTWQWWRKWFGLKMEFWLFLALGLLLPPPGVEKVQVHTSLWLWSVISQVCASALFFF